MAILPILCYPDPRLHKVAKPVAAVDERIQTLVADMLATMYDAHGIEGLLAVCIQHEMDHLMGKVFVEYLSPLKRNRIKTKMVKQQRGQRE
jgi:peptide deformylase